MSGCTRRKDGRLQKAITDPRTGRRVYFYGATEREINRKVLAFSRKAEAGATFKEVADDWWEEHEKEIARSTAISYHSYIVDCVSFFGEIPIRNITVKDVEQFLIDVAEANGGRAKSSVRERRVTLGMIFKHAARKGLVNSNPVSVAHLPKGTGEKKRQAATPEEEAQVLRSLADDDLPLGVSLPPAFALLAGMRRGEICGLKWEDIDFDQNTITVRRSVDYSNPSLPLVKTPKTAAGVRTIPLLSLLRERLLRISPRNPETFVCSGTEEPPQLTSTTYYYRQLFQRKYNIKAGLHQMRHSYATRAFEAGLDAKQAQSLLGHASVKTTMDIYTDFRKKSLEDAAKKLETALSAKNAETSK